MKTTNSSIYIYIYRSLTRRYPRTPVVYHWIMFYIPLLIIFIIKVYFTYFTLYKSRSIRYLSVNITNADYADDLVMFANSCSDVDIPFQSLESSAKRLEYIYIPKTPNVCYTIAEEILDLWKEIR